LSLRIGILGGTFDPVHNAHLAVAGAALRALGLEEILWLPTGTPPYRAAPVASAAHRVAMLRLAIEHEPRYAVDERELSAAASGYTYDSIKAMQQEDPQAQFTLLMGADQYEKRSTWHRWADLAKLCHVAVVARPGCRIDAGAQILAMPPSDVSASVIRARIARGADVSGMVPAAVLGYIRDKGLYH
jgi:nicotinate-nucleotide adenylyltransferase